MEWPQITMIVLLAMSFMLSAVKNGQPKENFNVFYTLISIVIWTTLLSYGGFF